MKCDLNIHCIQKHKCYQLNVTISTGVVNGFWMDGDEPLFDENEDTGFSVYIELKFGLKHIFKPIIINQTGHYWWDSPQLTYTIPLKIKNNQSLVMDKSSNKSTVYRLLLRLVLHEGNDKHYQYDFNKYTVIEYE